MAVFAVFSLACENIFLVGEKTVQSIHEKVKKEESVSYSWKFRKIRETQGWKKRMACPPFVEEYSKRKNEFENSLKKARNISRLIFIDAPFLKKVVCLIENDFSRAVILLCRDILKATGRERQSWIQLTSYMTLIQAPPSRLNLKKLQLDVGTLRDFPKVDVGFFYKTKTIAQETRRFIEEFHETPWISFERIFDALFNICTARQELPPSKLPPWSPRIFLDTFSLLESDPKLSLAVEHGGSEKLLKRLEQSDEIPELIRDYLLRFPQFQPRPPKSGPGRPPTIRLLWMRKAAQKGCKWKEFRYYFKYSLLTEEQRRALDEDIRRVLYKKV